MLNFTSLFNQLRSNPSSGINELLDSPDTTIEQLLDEDSFPNEFKTGNNKILQFMKYGKFREMTRYVTTVGPADDQKKGYKYPLVACDILSAEGSPTIDFFFPDSQLFEDLAVGEEQSVSNQQMPDTVAQTSDSLGNTEAVEDTADGTAVDRAREQNPNSENEVDSTSEQVEAAGTDDKNLIKVKGRVQRNEKVKVQPLIHNLFCYFEGGVNYTLAAYVSKILMAFFNKKPVAVMGYLLAQQRFEQLMAHIESRSVAELIIKIMVHQSADLMEQRKEAYQKILIKLSNNTEAHIMSNISQCICEIMEKIAANAKGQNPIAQLSAAYFDPTVFSTLVINVMSEQENVCVYNAPALLAYLTHAPLNIHESQEQKNSFKQLINRFLINAVSKLQVTKAIRKTVGLGRLKMIQILSFLLRGNLFEFRETVGRNRELLPTLLGLLRNYEMNNILHNEVLKIIELALSEDKDSLFLKALLEQDVLLDFIVKEAEEDSQIRTGSTSRKTRKGYIWHVVTICHHILENASANEAIDLLSERQEFRAIAEGFVEQETFKQRKALAGYHQIKKPVPNILFLKEEIAETHFKFLSACLAPVFPPQPETVNIEHGDAQAVSFDNPAQALSVPNDCNVPQDCNAPQIGWVNDWVKHLSYDLETLMNDL